MSAVWTLRRGETGYPACLHDLDERAPGVLYGVGDRSLVVGTRPRSRRHHRRRRAARAAYGRGVAHELGYGAGAAGLVVVSGMALGCDSAAHEGALAAGGRTVAVLGNGPDIPYPRSKADLHGRSHARAAR